MRVFVALEQRFVACHGQLYADSVAHYEFWKRYLDVFDGVTIVARVRPVEQVPDGWLQATGERVDFSPMPYYLGPSEFLRCVAHYNRAARKVAKQSGAFILRVPGVTGDMLWFHLLQLRKPFALEVVGDPYDSLSPLFWKQWWIRPIQFISVRLLKWQCQTATAGIAYVTREALQRRYPLPRLTKSYNIPTGVRVYSISDAQLPLETAPATPRAPHKARQTAHQLIFVGTLGALYKGQEILLKAVSECIRTGFNIELTIIGDGIYREKLEALSCMLGVSEYVRFLGNLSKPEDVFRQLSQAHLFVLPSYTEGLPRAMIEAMAFGLPCIGSTVGGIPELLPVEDLVPPGDAKALSHKICEVLSDPHRMIEMSTRNLAVAQGYRVTVLRERRIEFYRHIKDSTEDSLKHAR